MIDYDAKDTKPSEGYVLPKGWYHVQIIDYTSQAGDRYPQETITKKNKYPSVNMLLQVMDGQHKDQRIFHSVTLMPADKEGAGMALHFLKTIGMPYEGKFQINVDDWVGQELLVYTIPEEYNGKVKPKVSQVKPVPEGQNADIQKAKKDNDVPF